MRSREYSNLLQYKLEFAIWTRGMRPCVSSIIDLASSCVRPYGGGRPLNKVDFQEAVEDDFRLGFAPAEKRLRGEVKTLS